MVKKLLKQLNLRVVFVLVFAAAGVGYLMMSGAATNSTSHELEGGIISGNASIGSDPNASDGQFISFGGSSQAPITNVRAMFYYPWFPEAWNQQGFSMFTNYSPTLGRYSSTDAAVINKHIDTMIYAGMNSAIYSWWGQNSKEDVRFQSYLDATGSKSLKWALYHECEGNGGAICADESGPAPTVAAITSDLNYIKTKYASDNRYLKLNNKPVILVYGDGTDSCTTATNWKTAAASTGFYVVLKVFSGFRTCPDQPDGWHQYGPAKAEDVQDNHAITISPGYWKKGCPTGGGACVQGDTQPFLARDITRWTTNVTNLKNSTAKFQLVTTFNEWGEGSIVESANEWPSASGYGQYIDILHDILVTSTTTPPAATVTIAAAGDIACGVGSTSAPCRQMITSDLLTSINPAAILALGDVQYEYGNLSDFLGFFEPSWGRFKSLIKPAIGNHEYGNSVGGTSPTGCDVLTTNNPASYACGYFDYFNGKGNSTGAAGERGKGYYAYDLGGWRLYAMNSNCSRVGGCQAGSAQEQWLRQDLASHPGKCKLMYMHHPFSSSDPRNFDGYLVNVPDATTYANLKRNTDNLAGIYQAFYDHKGDLVLVGHSHFYERYDLQNMQRLSDPANGFRQIIVGTGGRNTYIIDSANKRPLSQISSPSSTFGVLKLNLKASSYDWNFIPAAGSTFTDSGSTNCHI